MDTVFLGHDAGKVPEIWLYFGGSSSLKELVESSKNLCSLHFTTTATITTILYYYYYYLILLLLLLLRSTITTTTTTITATITTTTTTTANTNYYDIILRQLIGSPIHQSRCVIASWCLHISFVVRLLPWIGSPYCVLTNPGASISRLRKLSPHC